MLEKTHMHLSLSHLKIRFNTTFAALRYRNYRAYLIGFVISVTGMWVQRTTAGFLIYDLTGSATYLGFFGFAQGFAFILLALLSGVIADRVPRRKMLIITQSGMLLQAVILSALTFSGLIQAWHVIILTFLLGVVQALDSPNRLSFISEMVEPKDLSNAIPVHSMIVNFALIFGPIIAGLMYYLVGPGWLFLFNAITFLAFIIPLMRMRTTHETDYRNRQHTPALSELKNGIRYAFSNHIIRLLLLSLFLFNIFGLSVRNLSPAWATNVLQGDAATNGWLVSAVGVGAVLGTYTMASLSYKRIRGKIRGIGGFLFAFSLIILALIKYEWVSLLMFMISGSASLMISNNTLGIIQTRVSDEMRGRVTGIFSTMFMGGSTIGSLLVGYLADQAGEQMAVLLFGLVLLGLSMYLWFRQKELRALA